ncbi:hypothetical protein HHK36_009457 [Tetracentron sinense]|uniref:Trehalose 6-phosphate phosphatase n=1 Tax=Tetracentron sinense TaxID=13715 RepID=A0A834ZCW8_TETSI|nr:hypothetical protein HHK36_009457 [Tetracentron sinense]
MTKQNEASWVESMKALSPTSSTSLPATDYQASWILHHPSALSMFEHIINASKGKEIVMFLDYDGTLTPIVEDPDQAFMSDAMRAEVKNVARYFPTAIVSGRCTNKVYSFVQLAGLYYAGSHGMDIKGPANGYKYKNGNPAVLIQPASEFLPMIEEVYKALVEKTKSTPGAKVENNKFCVSVHFRCVEEKVLEIRPTIKWDKGKALEFLLESLGLADCNDVLALYIGDDLTDEDAFKVLRDRGQGFGILVSKIPKDTSASYSLQEPCNGLFAPVGGVEETDYKRAFQGLNNRRNYPHPSKRRQEENVEIQGELHVYQRWATTNKDSRRVTSLDPSNSFSCKYFTSFFLA